MSEFRTPTHVRTKSVLQKEIENGSPRFIIPPSPAMRKLGLGTGVNVYLLERFSPVRGCYKSPWAVKKINRKTKLMTKVYEVRLNSEAEILKGLNHPNIIGYRSYTKTNDGTPCLIMESGDRSLADWIEFHQESNLGPFSSDRILKVAKDLASALHYLHEDTKLLHGDLKSANILIKGMFESIKLCDFGVTLKLDDKGLASNEDEYVGTECWSAPEALIGGIISSKTDIFTYGLILWEMLALSPPHVDKLDCGNADDSKTSSDSDNAMEYNDEAYQKVLGTRPALPDIKFQDDYLPVLELFYACTEAEPEKRPSAGQIVHILHCLEDTYLKNANDSSSLPKQNSK